MRSAFFALLLSIAVSQTAVSTVIRVPGDYPTIRQGMNALLANDTLLVDTGLYVEALIAPAIPFWFIGNVTPDTGEYARPIVDASLTPDSVHHGCLTLPMFSEATIERMCFRNMVPMFNRPGVRAGGVCLDVTDTATFRDCLFDGTFYGVWQAYGDSGHVLLDHCVFRANPLEAVFAGSTTVHATDCQFSDGGDMGTVYQFICGPGSLVENCHFRKATNTTLSNWGNPDVIVRNCIFGPDSGAQYYYVELIDYSGHFENNVFADLRLYYFTVKAGVDCRQEAVFSGNTFYNIRHLPGPPRFDYLLYTGCDTVGDQRYLVDQNVMSECTTFAGAVWAHNSGLFTRNRIHNIPMSPPTPAIWVNSANAVFSENLIYDNGYAMGVAQGLSADALRNWWGDSTGPYHATQNPGGQGDTIMGNVDFTPWYPDSSFLSVPGIGKPLPKEFTFEAYPNPFNSTVHLRLIPNDIQIVKVELFDLLGRRVSEVWKGPLAFQKDLELDATNLASGVYFARVTNSIYNRQLAMTKLLLLK